MTAFVDWLTATPLSQVIQNTSWAIPGIQVIHIVCLATLFALALNLSLRVAGRGLVAESLASLAGLNMLYFQIITYRHVAAWDSGRPPSAARLAGFISIGLWCSVIGFGRWIGFTS